MEGEHFIKTGKLLKLSEQQFVDCDTGSKGCNGGHTTGAFKYAETNPQELSKDYPYTAKDGSCKASKSKEIVKTSGYTWVSPKSDKQLKAAIAKQPTSVSVNSSTDFHHYTSGILNDKNCGSSTNHAIVAVGYGADSKGQEYYLVRNSWGASWGEKGYIRVAAGMDGVGICGILTKPSRPTTN